MAGIAFYINNEQLQLAQKISISMESPILGDKTIPGAISFPFNIEASSWNKRLLNISDTLMSFDEKQTVKCQCYLGGNFWKNGYIIINNQYPKTINISFTEFNSEEDFDNKSLQDLVFPEFDTSEIFYNRPAGTLSAFHQNLLLRAAQLWGHPSVPDKDFVCPTIFNVKTLDVARSFGFQNLMSNGNYGTGHYDEITGNTISPCLFVNYVLKALFKNFNIEIASNKLTESDLDDLILYTNRANLMTLRTSVNPAENFDGLMDEPVIKLSEYVPAASLTDFLASLKKAFNLTYLINWGKNKVDIVCKSDILKSNRVIDITAIAQPFDNMTFKTDFKAITAVCYGKKDDGIINDDPARFSLKGYNYKGHVYNVSDIPNVPHQVNDYYIITHFTLNSVDSYAIVYYNENGSWESLLERTRNSRPYDVYFSNLKKENKLDLGIDAVVTRENKTHMATADVNGVVTISEADYYRYFCPVVDIGIASNTHHYPGDLQPGGKTDMEVIAGLHLMFYRGMRVEMKDGGYFPYANRNEFDFEVIGPGAPDDAEGNPPFPENPELEFSDAFDHSLEIDGPKGLWAKFYQDWENFRASLTRMPTFNIRWAAVQLQDMAIWKDFYQIHGNRFILSKITITADVNTIYPCKTEMYQIQPQ